MIALDSQVLLKPATKIQRNYPANMLAADIDDFKDDTAYETYDTFLKFYKNAQVSPDSVVYQNGLLVRETVYTARYTSYYRLRHFLKKILTSRKVELDENRKYLLATDLESEGHFHWFTEVLPRLLCARDYAGEFVLLLPDKPYIRRIALDSLKLLRLDFRDIVLMKDAEFYKIRNLYYISRLSRTGQFHDAVMKQMRDELTAGAFGEAERRIYISREKARFRKVLNEDDLSALLKNYGFEIWFGEESSLAEQIELFAATKTLVGIHGAGLTNSVFMNADSQVVELRRKETEKNTGYWHLADSLDHRYYYYNGIPDSEKSIIGRGCNLTIPIADFEEKILRIL
jgi:Glycosyltransferase 61